MMWYDMYLLQSGFHPVAVFDNLYQNMKETAMYRSRNNTQSNKQKKYKNAEYTKEEPDIEKQNRHKKNIRNKSSNYNITKSSK
jgi:hypothetical protein